MSPAVHKIFMHGKEIIAKGVVTIVMLSEEAQKASNKLIRRFSEHSSRKITRELTMKDGF